MKEKKPNQALVIILIVGLTVALLASGFAIAESMANEFIFFPFLIAAGVLPTLIVNCLFYPKEKTSIKKVLFTLVEYRFLNQHSLRAVKKDDETDESK